MHVSSAACGFEMSLCLLDLAAEGTSSAHDFIAHAFTCSGAIQQKLRKFLLCRPMAQTSGEEPGSRPEQRCSTVAP